MAMSDTNSGPAHWPQLGGWPSDSVLAPAAASTSTVGGIPKPTAGIPAPRGGAAATAATQQPGIEGGRVGKPARRRSRASRRAPTTMLNTDTTNFRSMVQQFTGIPSGPYSSAGFRSGGGAMPSMGYEPINKATLMSFGHLHLQQQQHDHHQFPDHASLIAAIGGGAAGGSSNNSSSGRNDDGFLQALNNSGTNFEVGDGFFFDGMFNQMMPRPTSTSNEADGYFS